MIKSYEEYLSYLEADRIALGREKRLKALLFDDVWQFQRLMRKVEYLTNCKGRTIRRLLHVFRYYRLGRKLGFSIPFNVFGPGLAIAHYGNIIVNPRAKVGANCQIHPGVTIGHKSLKMNAAPCIGNNCYIGPGAKIFGAIVLGDNIAVGANAVVNRSFPEGNITIAGIPARKVSCKTSADLLQKGWL